MLNFDTSLRPRRPGEWAAILDGVYNAAKQDEQHWLEWKSEIDLRSKEQIADKIAKHVVAMANRDPEIAKLQVGGVGIIVLGMEPGNVVGVQQLDNADLDKQISPYVGDDGPVWQAHWDLYGGKTILVIEVEPPKPGDAMHSIRKEVGRFLDGSVYVRRMARSEPAKSVDLRRLTSRACELVTQELNIAVSLGNGEELQPCLSGGEYLQNYLSNESKRLAVPEVNLYFGSEAEEAQYALDVEEYLASIEANWEAFVASSAAFVLTPAEFLVHNRAGRNLTALAVEVELSGVTAVLGVEDDPKDFSFTKGLPPKMTSPSERRVRRAVGDLGSFLVHSPYYPELDLGDETTVDKYDDGDVSLRFPELDVRIGRTGVLENELVLVVLNEHREFTVRWAATAANIDAEARGEFTVTMSQAPVNAIEEAARLRSEALHDDGD